MGVAESSSRRRSASSACLRRSSSCRRRRREEALRRAERERAAQTRRTRARWLKIGGYASAGVGLVGLGLGVKFGLDAKSASDALSGHTEGMWTDELLAKEKEGKDAEVRMFVFTGAGAALVAAGGVLYYLGTRADARAQDLTGGLAVSGDSALLVLGGRF